MNIIPAAPAERPANLRPCNASLPTWPAASRTAQASRPQELRGPVIVIRGK